MTMLDLRAERVRAGVRQRDLADALGMNASTFAAFESNSSSVLPTITWARAYLDALAAIAASGRVRERSTR